ncbi:Unknown protein, partial [Striga hermonthica]
EMQRIVAEAAAQAVQQVTNSLSRATATPNTVAGSRQNAEEDESSYGGGRPTHDREMERMAEQLRQLQAKVDGRAERRARGHPFSADILAAPLPNNYKDTNLVFDGTSDPSRHVRTFENMAVLHGYTDPVSCRAFLSTLRGGALDWFQQLPPGSIVDFEDFVEKLTNQYSSAVAQEKTYLTLMAMRQGEKESLRRGSKDQPNRSRGDIAAFTKTMAILLRIVGISRTRLILERLIRAGHIKEFVYQNKGRRKEKRRCREDSVERSEEDDDEDARGGRDGRKRDEGKRRRGSREREREGDGGQVKRGTIYMISGGPTDGDSNNARRGHVRAMKRKREEVSITARVPEISFRAEDAAGVVVPHNDALVITAEVEGFDVKRVFIDTGSSVDVMFYDCFVQINRELNVELKPVATALYGFNGGEVMPMGEVTLSVALGKGATRKVRMVRFVVVGADSSYNIIMGRTSLNAFQAVLSTYHMTIKYPVGENVGEIAVDQLTSRSCYQTTVRNNKQLARRQ